MSSLEVTSLDNKKVGTVEIPGAIAAEEFNANLIHSVVKWQLAGKRQGTHMTKTKGLVSGGGKKPFKQKGTGNARQGSTRSPLMPGGGTTFGPQPRDYSFVMPKKMKKTALRMVLSYLIKNNKLKLVDALSSDGKTNKLNKQLLGLGFKKAVLSDLSSNTKLNQASKNLQSFKFLPSDAVNVFDLLKYDALIISKASFEDLSKKLLAGKQ
ncbi:MAG: 50S ribosomal protein L4 [Bdellovibrionaceae bacterium]|nr:50S ribosomal protein L4 [Pseudobdellovibrionaceae bacterium]